STDSLQLFSGAGIGPSARTLRRWYLASLAGQFFFAFGQLGFLQPQSRLPAIESDDLAFVFLASHLTLGFLFLHFLAALVPDHAVGFELLDGLLELLFACQNFSQARIILGPLSLGPRGNTWRSWQMRRRIGHAGNLRRLED